PAKIPGRRYRAITAAFLFFAGIWRRSVKIDGGMRYRKLGKTEAEISEIGFGAWGIGGKQWLGGEDDESERALKRAFELGVNFVDTALAYGDGHSEQLVGQAVRSTFHRIYVATKVPPKNGIWPASASTPIYEVFPYDYIIESTN